MRFVTTSDLREFFKGKSIAIVGSGPSALNNEVGVIDSYDIVVRVNNYKIEPRWPQLGKRCDVYYSFFGGSIKKSVDDLKRDGVKLCMCKLPNSQPLESEWHRKRGAMLGIDYRYIYRMRAPWWFCDTFIPDDAWFLEKFHALSDHQPTTGMAAIMDILKLTEDDRGWMKVKIFVTGFDFFSSGVHNVDEKWKAGDPTDPIKHSPEHEIAWLKNMTGRAVRFDPTISDILARP